MTNILLISEDTLKTYSHLNDNVWGKSLTPAIITAIQTVIAAAGIGDRRKGGYENR